MSLTVKTSTGTVVINEHTRLDEFRTSRGVFLALSDRISFAKNKWVLREPVLAIAPAPHRGPSAIEFISLPAQQVEIGDEPGLVRLVRTTYQIGGDAPAQPVEAPKPAAPSGGCGCGTKAQIMEAVRANDQRAAA